MVTSAQILSIAPASGRYAGVYAAYLSDAMSKFSINSPARAAAFLAQVAVESQSFSRIIENLNYSDPVRVAKIFRSGFDLDHDGVIEPSEIEFAKGYIHNAQKLANRAYAGRNGNGDEASGDGWAFRGRGLIQTTGRNNYAACGSALDLDLISHPELLEQPESAALSAAWYWSSRGLNALADTGDFTAITQKINGGLTGLADRLAFWARAKAVLGGGA